MFVRDYLSVKQQAIPSMNKIYVSFKAYVEEAQPETEDLLKDMLQYAKWYEQLLKGNTGDKKLNACIQRLNRLETTVTRPFFLEVFRLHKEAVISGEDVREIFLTTENYLFRRSICGIPTNALNKIFLTLHRDIIRYDGKKEKYLDKFKYALLAKSDSGLFPRDDDFSDALETRQIYLMNTKNKAYIFERFENYGIDEDKDIYRHMDEGIYSIEHIMPQNLTPEWIEALGNDYEDIHKTWLHRLANLTLTAYNSKYSNSKFTDKRDMQKGFKESGLRLNTWIAQQSKWTLTELESRNTLMISRALEIWPLPETDYKPSEKQMDSYTLDDDTDLSGRVIARFGFKNAEQPVESWIDMQERVVRILNTEDKSVLVLLAHTHDSGSELDYYFSDDPSKLRGALEIEPGIYMERNTSTSVKLSMLRKLFKAFGQNPEDLTFYLKDQNDAKYADEAGTRYEQCRKYWSFALDYIKASNSENGLFQNRNTSKDSWISASIGISGFHISCNAKQKEAYVCLVLGNRERETNKSAYGYIETQKEDLENELGVQLDWNRYEGKSSYISYHLNGVSVADESSWTQMAKFHAEWSRKFHDVFVPLLEQWESMR